MTTFIPEPIASMGIAGGISFAICHISNLVRDFSNLSKPITAQAQSSEQRSLEKILNFKTAEPLPDDESQSLEGCVLQKRLDVARQLFLEGKQIIIRHMVNGEKGCNAGCGGCLRINAAVDLVDFAKWENGTYFLGVETLLEAIEIFREMASDCGHYCRY